MTRSEFVKDFVAHELFYKNTVPENIINYGCETEKMFFKTLEKCSQSLQDEYNYFIDHYMTDDDLPILSGTLNKKPSHYFFENKKRTYNDVYNMLKIYAIFYKQINSSNYILPIMNMNNTEIINTALVWTLFSGSDCNCTTLIGCQHFGHCYICEKNISSNNFNVAHMLSKKHGGTDNIWNLRPICQNCNCSLGSNNIFTLFDKDFIGCDMLLLHNRHSS